FQVQPVVNVCDADDVVCVGENAATLNAYITPATGSDHAILLGTNPITVVGGVANFTDLGIDRPGQGYSLSFSTTPSFFGATTNSIDILGESTPSNNSDTAFTAGLDGGSCTSGAAATPWLLLSALATFSLLAITLPRRQRG
ncbi:MAG: hypothetical protein IT462_07300, partial [Planctomycetes bacterium]|nr:hypothetical protein [Planctomycetota bacterium]